MTFSLATAVPLLSCTPALLRAWLAPLPEAWTHSDYGPDTFSPFEVLGHLIHGERTDWMARLRIIFANGEARPFDPFDRFAQRHETRGKTLADLLHEFEALRAANLADLAALRLTETQLDLRGTHPALGRVTARELLATWVVHDLNHVKQIAFSMAHQYRDDVGPWREYLPILQR